MKPNFRLAVKEDLSVINHLLKQTKKRLNSQNLDYWNEEYPTCEMIEDDIEKKMAYVAVFEDEIAAYGALQEDYANRTEVVVMSRIMVSPKFRRRGLAKDIILCLEEYAKSLGYRQAMLWVDVINRRILPLYRKLGYTNKGLVHEPWEDVYELYKIL